MIERYSLPEMKKIWSNENRFQQMLQVEIYACEAMRDMGNLDPEIFKIIKDKATFDPQRIIEIEEVTRHDVVAFLMAIAEKIGDENAKYMHRGMTASDILDTSLSVQMKQAAELIIGKLDTLRSVLIGLAKKHKYTLMVGRTHGVHAEPMTFGMKMALWVTDIDRCIERMNAAKATISVGKVSGVVGSFAHVDPFVEEHVCRRLGLKPAPVSTQVLQRDRHAFFISAIAIIGSVLEKFATEIRNLERTEISEISEPFLKGQRGSSALPHKLNPVRTERISGLARVLRANSLAAMEDITLWHERDMTHSSVERIIIPDSCTLIDYMLQMTTETMQRAVINVDIMRDNLDKTQGLIFSQRVLLALMEHGLTRDEAFGLVQRNATGAYNDKTDFEYYIMQDEDIMNTLSFDELNSLFDYEFYLKHLDYIFARAGIE